MKQAASGAKQAAKKAVSNTKTRLQKASADARKEAAALTRARAAKKAGAKKAIG
jgi:hypothetical protein